MRNRKNLLPDLGTTVPLVKHRDDNAYEYLREIQLCFLLCQGNLHITMGEVLKPGAICKYIVVICLICSSGLCTTFTNLCTARYIQVVLGPCFGIFIVVFYGCKIFVAGYYFLASYRENNIEYSSIMIYDGGVFDGYCELTATKLHATQQYGRHK